MPNTRAAKRAVRTIARRTEVNRVRKSRVRTFIRRVNEALAAGDANAAREALREAQPEIMRGAQKGVMEKNTASRTISRLAQRVRKLNQA
jgi:small subunit ribosomal protein S20